MSILFFLHLQMKEVVILNQDKGCMYVQQWYHCNFLMCLYILNISITNKFTFVALHHENDNDHSKKNIYWSNIYISSIILLSFDKSS